MGPRKKPNEQVRLKRTSQIWRPSEIPADAGSQIWFSRIALEINLLPKLCKPSHEAHQTSSFQTYSTSQIWRPSEIPADAGPQILFSRIYLEIDMRPKLCRPSKNPNEQARLKGTSQIWRPSKIPADAGSQTWFSSTYPKTNMRPELCKPSHEALQTSSFKTYLPNLTAFKNSSRRWITDLVF